jgi:hypothetical protein
MTDKTAPSLMIATPMYGGMCSGHYVRGLLQTVAAMQRLSMPVYWAHTMNESLITRARDELVRMFLDADYDYLMFIDADIAFDGTAVAHLMAADKDIVCGIYPKKEVDWKQVARAAKDNKEDLENYGGAFVFNMIGGEDAETDESGVLEVRHGGTGFMLIKRGVFDHLKPHVPTYRINSHKDPQTKEYVKPLVHQFFTTSIDESGTLLSEDYHFCELYRKHGGKIHANPFIKLNHIGTYVYTGDILKSGGRLK